jgi:SAM-dependent methyltransferase
MNPAPGGIALTEKLLNLSLLQKGSMILDVGCGDGDACRFLSSEGYRAIGLDIVRHSSGKMNSERIQGQINAIPILEETVDAVLMECVLSILPTDDGSLTEIIRVLKPGGILLFPDEELEKNRIDSESDYPKIRLADELLNIFGESGLSVRYWEDQSAVLQSLRLKFLWEGSASENKFPYKMKNIGYICLIAERVSASG